MTLLELRPRWVHQDIFIFFCPHCRKVWLSCKRVKMPLHEQMEILAESVRGEELKEVVPCREGMAWSMRGAFEKGNFTVTPSLDASKSGHWHGHITKGFIT